MCLLKVVAILIHTGFMSRQYMYTNPTKCGANTIKKERNVLFFCLKDSYNLDYTVVHLDSLPFVEYQHFFAMITKIMGEIIKT